MLFDLRSRGRRTTVRGVYLFLAVLMGGGLILFGVGTGTGGGGLLNAFSNSGGGNSGAVHSAAVKNALRQTRLHPSDPSVWSALVSAEWGEAGQQTSSKNADVDLQGATNAWQRYLQLTGGKDPSGVAILAARAYGLLGDYAGEASAWEVYAAATPTAVKGYECLAAAAYAAKQNRKGDLALNKALSMIPKLNRALLRSQVQAAKTQPTVAAQC
jgi:hypothetical protein